MNYIKETIGTITGEAAFTFSEILQRLRGMITAPIYTAVPGRLTVHAGELDFEADGRWVTAAMATNGRVICFNGYGKVEICDTADEAVEAVNRLYENAMTRSDFKVTVDATRLHFLRLATPGENPEVTDGRGKVEMLNGNLMLFAKDGDFSYANPDTHRWYEATICNQGVLCATSEGAFKVCRTIDELIKFLYFNINPDKLKKIQQRAKADRHTQETSALPPFLAECLKFCGGY